MGLFHSIESLAYVVFPVCFCNEITLKSSHIPNSVSSKHCHTSIPCMSHDSIGGRFTIQGIYKYPDLVMTEKGVSDLTQHFLVKNNISCLRRLKKSDNNRMARAVSANIVGDTIDLKEEDLGTGCGLFEIKKIGDEYFSYIIKCKNPKACSIVLRGAIKDLLNEAEMNLQDAMQVI